VGFTLAFALQLRKKHGKNSVKTLETFVLRNVGTSVPVEMELRHVAGIVIKHRHIYFVCELFRGLEEFPAERRTLLGETFHAFLSFP
jgi:hypothetical protein